MWNIRILVIMIFAIINGVSGKAGKIPVVKLRLSIVHVGKDVMLHAYSICMLVTYCL